LEIEEAKKEFEESILAEAENGGTSVNEVGI